MTWHRKGYLHLNLDEPALGIAAATKAIELGPRSEAARFNRAKMYLDIHDRAHLSRTINFLFSKARNLPVRLAFSSPKRECQWEIGTGAGKRFAILSSPRNAMPKRSTKLRNTLRAGNEIESRKLNQQMLYLRQAAVCDPSHYESRLDFGYYAPSFPKVRDEAIRYLTEAIRLRPAEWSPYLNRANLYLQSKDLDKATVDIAKTIEVAPDVDADTMFAPIWTGSEAIPRPKQTTVRWRLEKPERRCASSA